MSVPVLVVDDDVGIREALHWVLEDAGYSVFEAPDGRPALDRLHDHPDGMVVLLDLNMPGLDGYAVLSAVEANRALATRHAFILMTAVGRTLPLAVAQQLIRLNVPVIDKPFALEVLLDTVEGASARVRRSNSE